MSDTGSIPFNAEEIASEGIKPEEYQEIVNRLGRHPNKAELGMFGVMWSEHCCYKNSRPLLSQFPTTGERVLVGPGENAGVVDLGNGLRLAFKIESHNHPSAVEPFQGAATGVGGILRDIFTMGARPIAILNSLRFGNLSDARTRRIFQGVVEGISHYGNCLVADETFVWRDDEGVYFDTIGNFVESRLPEHCDTYELLESKSVETLSYNSDTGQSCWQPVRRIFRRSTDKLIKIRTALGRSLTVTPDHSVLTLEHGDRVIKPAAKLVKGDCLPLLLDFPYSEEYSAKIDLLAILGEHQNVYVDLPSNWQPSPEAKTALKKIESSAVQRHRYWQKGYLRLAHFLKLESLLNISRQELKLYRRSGKANYHNAVVSINDLFARLIGYYLSEGCISRNGNTYKIIFTFAHHELEYVRDVIAGLESLGLRPCTEKRTSTIIVYATSWLWGYVLKEVWHSGDRAENKAIPAFVFGLSNRLQREVLKGLFRGDALTTKTNSSHAKITKSEEAPSFQGGVSLTYATVSKKLFEQILVLLQSQEIVPYIYCKPFKKGTIEGREYVSLPLWQLEINNFSGLTLLSDIFSEERNRQLATALGKYDGDKYSFPRYFTADKLAFVKIKDVKLSVVGDTSVYDVEVDNTHLFTTTSGIITHNCIGVPTVAGEIYFDKAYTGNPLVNAMALGLMETEEIVKSGASGIGNPVLYVGSTTGRDGMGGASFASAELTDDSMDDRPAVQVGDPFLEKSLVEACLEAFKTGAVVAAQDMGAAGLTCSTSEMADKGGVGIELDLDLIPARETGMTPYEYLLSESQERMLFVAQKGREQELIEIFHKWELQAVVAGSVIEEPVVRILYQGEVAAEVTATALADDTPIYHRELLSEPPAYAKEAARWTADSLPGCDYEGIDVAGTYKTWNEILLQLLDTPTIASKQWVYRQYDHQVQNNTILLPGGADAAVVRVRPIDAKPGDCTIGVAATTDCNPRYVYLDPYEGAKAAVAEAARNLSCVGAEPLAVTDNLNFGSPEKPVGYWQLANACKGIADACRVMSTPVTGGNVSLYNETLDSQGNPQPIYPTPVIGMVGLVPDITKICGQSWVNKGDLIYLLGNSQPTLAASEYLAAIYQTVAGKPPAIDLELEKKVQAACRHGIRQGWIKSAHDLAEGGLAVALAEACIGNSLGAMVNIPVSESQRLDEILFGEAASQIVVSLDPEQVDTWETYLQDNLNECWSKIGIVDDPQSSLNILTNDNLSLINVKIKEMSIVWSQAIENRLA